MLPRGVLVARISRAGGFLARQDLSWAELTLMSSGLAWAALLKTGPNCSRPKLGLDGFGFLVKYTASGTTQIFLGKNCCSLL